MRNRNITLACRRAAVALAAVAALLLGSVPGLADGDAAAGKQAFTTTCGACHSTEPGVNKIGPSLAGKIHMYVGDMDNHYLNLAVYAMENEASKLTNPKANFTFEYGRPMKPHGWQPMTNAEMVRMMDRFRSEHRTQP